MRTFPVEVFIIALCTLAVGACGGDGSTAKATTLEAEVQEPSTAIAPPEATATAPAVTTVTFPDENLAAAIRGALGKPPGEEITTAELAELTELEAGERGIADLTGIEHLTNLSKLVLWRNQISDISPLASLSHLTHLNIGDNRISDIFPLESLSNLTDYLNLSQNRIDDISPLSSLSNLTFLLVMQNHLTDISPLASLTNLTDLRLPENQISDISPLVDNSGLGRGDEVLLGHNPLDLSEGLEAIRTLQERGVRVPISEAVAVVALEPDVMEHLVGHWEGTSGPFEITIAFEPSEGGLRGSIYFPIEDSSFALTNVRVDYPKVQFESAHLERVYDAELEGDTLSGLSLHGGEARSFSVRRVEAGEEPEKELVALEPGVMEHLVGRWEGTSGPFEITIAFEPSEGGLRGSIYFPIEDSSFALTNIRVDFPKVQFESVHLERVYEAELEGDTLSGRSVRDHEARSFSVTRVEAGEEPGALEPGLGTRPIDGIRLESQTVHFEYAGAVYEGELKGDTISGTAVLRGQSALFTLKRTAD